MLAEAVHAVVALCGGPRVVGGGPGWWLVGVDRVGHADPDHMQARTRVQRTDGRTITECETVLLRCPSRG